MLENEDILLPGEMMNEQMAFTLVHILTVITVPYVKGLLP